MIETFFTEKRIIKKIIIALVFIFMFNFTFSYLGNNVVFAAEGEVMEDKEIEEGGGKLLLPIHALILFVSDAVLELMQNSFISSDPVTIKAYSKDTSQIDGWAIAGIVIGVVVLAVACVVTYGAAAAAVGSVTTAVAGTTGAAAIGTAATAIGTAATTYGGTVVGGLIFAGGAIAGIAYSTDTFIDDIKGEFELPTIQYTPEAIFANRIPLFNINFFNPKEDKQETKTVKAVEETKLNGKIHEHFVPIISVSEYVKDKNIGKDDENGVYNALMEVSKMQDNLYHKYLTLISELNNSNLNMTWNTYDEELTKWYVSGIDYNSYIYKDKATLEKLWKEGDYYIENFNSNVKTLNDLIDYHAQNFTEEELKALAEVSPNAVKTEIVEKEEIVATYESSSAILQKTVASMYKTLRTVAIVALLSILVYVGIRMVISSTSKDKAKYKQMLMDWLVAFIMLFVLHYIMAFIIDISENLTKICNKSNVENVPIAIPNGTKVQDQEGNLVRLDGGDDSKKDVWSTNFIGSIRFYAGLVQKNGYTLKGISYTLMYVALVVYIVMFTFQYMKRVLYMAFLTMISPLVAITYPLDKINDGKAQGFSLWIREYIFNALLQPIHYVIYIIIMGSVMEMVINHPIYALVALGFMVPAEKFIRKMFGFEKAGTVGAFGGAAGAAMLMSGVQRLTHRPHGKKNDDNGAKGEQDNPNGKVRTISSIPEGPGGNNGTPNGGGNTPIGGGTDDSGIIPGINPPRITGGLTDGNENNNSQWHSRLSQEQRDELNAEGIMPGDAEYDNALRNYGIDPNKPDWDSRLSQEQRDELNAEGIMPGDAEYDNALRNYGINPTNPSENNTPRATTSTGTITPPPVNPTPAPVPTNIRRTVPSEPRTLYNRPKSGGFMNGLRAVGGHYTRRLDNKLRKSHPLRALRRGLTYAAGATALGTIGLAAGIASGDPSKALQYTMAGGIAGGNLGKNLGETASNIVGLEGAAKTFKKGALGDQYNEIERQKYKRDFKMNVSNYDAGIKKVGTNGWKDMSKEGGIIDTALDYGINNVDDMSNIYKTQQKFMNEQGMNAEEAQDLAFKAYKLDSQFGDYSSNSKTQENLDKILTAKGWSGEEKERVKKGMLNTMRAYQDATLEGNDRIEEPTFDYTRIAEQNASLNNDGSDINNNNRNNNDRNTDDRDNDGRNYNQGNTVNLMDFATNNQNTNNRQEEADAAVARADAEKAATRQKAENAAIQEELSKRAKAEKKAASRARANASKQKNEEAKRKRESTKQRNNVNNGEQGSSVNEFDSTKRNVKVNPIDLSSNSNPISSDPGTNGAGPIHTPKK